MSNTRLLLQNRCLAGTIRNGLVGAPARDETSPYVMDNALTADRYTPWQTSAAPGGTLDLEIDLGGAKTINCAAVHGFRQAGSSPITFIVFSSPDHVTWTQQGGSAALTNLPMRDAGIFFGSVTARYWRFEFTTFGSQFSVGRVALGSFVDLGAIGAPGLQFTRGRTRLETPIPGGAVVLRDLGDPTAGSQLPWQYANPTTLANLIQIRDQTGSFTLFDADDLVWEVYVRGGLVTPTRRWVNSYDFASELVALP